MESVLSWARENACAQHDMNSAVDASERGIGTDRRCGAANRNGSTIPSARFTVVLVVRGFE